MRVLEPVRRHAVVTVCVVAAGVAGWAATDRVRVEPPPAGVSQHAAAAARDDRMSGRRSFRPHRPPAEHQTIPIDVLPALKVGMTSAEIGELLGPTSAPALRPVEFADGRATYQATYELAEAAPPPTVRPIRRFRPAPSPVEPKRLVALEFDASKPGHPLLGVLYLDPLF